MKFRFNGSIILYVLLGFVGFYITPHILIFALLQSHGLDPTEYNPFDGTTKGRFEEAIGWILCVTAVSAASVITCPKNVSVAPLKRIDHVGVFLLIGLMSRAMAWLCSYSVGGIWIYGLVVVYCASKLYTLRYTPFQIIYGVLWLSTIQSVYAIALHALGIGQLYTPHFGPRTAGTLGSPNALYPISMMSFVIAFALCWNERQILDKILLTVFCLTNAISLTFTYSRAGWIGAAIGLIYLSRIRVKIGMNSKFAAVCLVLAVVVLIASFTVRTHGNLIGTSMDRSARGRFSIWQIAIPMIAQRPLLGYGIGSYHDDQEAKMSGALLAYNPQNVEAKSLYLNVGVEEGIPGLFALLWLIWFSLRAVPFEESMNDSVSSRKYSVRAAIICLAVAGLFDTPVWQSERLASTYMLFLILPILSHTEDKSTECNVFRLDNSI